MMFDTNEFSDAMDAAIKPIVGAVSRMLIEMERSTIIDTSVRMAKYAVEKYTAAGFTRDEAISMYLSSLDKTFGSLGRAGK